MGRHRKGKKMTEKYTYVDAENAREKRCVNAFGPEVIGDYTCCSGPMCMGWVAEIDDTGKPTGRGRCGMTHQIVITMPMVSMPFSSPHGPWWDANKVDG